MRPHWAPSLHELLEAWRTGGRIPSESLDYSVRKALLTKLISEGSMAMTMNGNKAVVVKFMADALKKFHNYREPTGWALLISWEEFEGTPTIVFSRVRPS